jgi:phosphomannomutase
MMQLTDPSNKKIVIGRDGRISGSLISNIVSSTLLSLGLDIIDLELSTTPTVELAVIFEKACGGIIITASHNPRQWNALKMLNSKGEFISAEDGQMVLEIAQKAEFHYANIDQIGSYYRLPNYIENHIDSILKLPLVDTELIKKANFRIVVDGINSSGGIAVPKLLTALGVKDIIEV